MKYVVVVDDLFQFVERYPSLTGIQRVIVQLIKKLANSYGADDVLLVTDGGEAGLRLLESTAFDSPQPLSPAEICVAFNLRSAYKIANDPRDLSVNPYVGRRASGHLSLERYVHRRTRGLRAVVRSYRLRGQNVLTRGGTYKRRGIVAPPAAVDPGLDGRRQLPSLQSLLKEGCVVFSPGAFWSLAAQKMYRFRGDNDARFKIAVVVYDLTPIRTSEFADAATAKHFEEWIREFLPKADRIFCISDYTSRDLATFARLQNITLPPIQTIPLAQEFPFAPVADFEARNDIRKLKHFPFVLSVGLLDGRKNNWSLVRVWGQIERELGVNTPLLVLAGGLDRPDQQLEESLGATRNLGGLIRVLVSPSDAELAWLYSNCLFTVYPSFFEGWGLPVGESLWFGKVVVTSRSSSLPEAGGEFASYFDINRIESLYEMCKTLIVDADLRLERENNINHEALRTWDMVCRDYFLALSELASSLNE